MSVLHLLNAPICHTPNLRYTTTRITREQALKLAAVAASRGKLNTAIGHDGTAQIMSTLLDMPIAVSRVSMQYQPGDTAICLQLRSRQPEGVILTAEQVEAIGYDLTLIETSPAPVLVIFGSAVEAARAMCAAGAEHPVPRPGDIDVIYGGMDKHEARERVRQWAHETGFDGEWTGPSLELDLHPELCWLSPASYTGHADLGDRVDFPARYEVKIPHPRELEMPPTIVLAGAPHIKSLPVNSLAAKIRQCATQRLTALQAGDAIAKFIANTRNGTCIVLRTERGEDASYLECSISAIRSAWRKLLAVHGDTHLDRDRAHDQITEHIDGYLRGVGVLLGRLTRELSPAALQRLRYEARDMTVPVFKEHGVLEIRRTARAENVWQAGGGELWDTCSVIARWLGNMSYVDPTKTLPV